MVSATPPSEPDGRISRIQLSSQWFLCETNHKHKSHVPDYVWQWKPRQLALRNKSGFVLYCSPPAELSIWGPSGTTQLTLSREYAFLGVAIACEFAQTHAE